MSQENAELLRRGMEAAEGVGLGAADARLDCLAGVEYLPPRSATEGKYRGLAAIERFNADTEEVFEKFELHYEFLDLGERVVAWGVIRVRARGSGIETDIATGGSFDFRDGKIVRWEDCGSKAAALKAVRLED